MSDLREAIRAATGERDKPENQKTSKQENQIARKPDTSITDDTFVNLAIRVSRRQRIHWLVEAKKEGTSLTAAIIEALNARFGRAAED